MVLLSELFLCDAHEGRVRDPVWRSGYGAQRSE
jgi:hypothetical protein